MVFGNVPQYPGYPGYQQLEALAREVFDGSKKNFVYFLPLIIVPFVI